MWLLRGSLPGFLSEDALNGRGELLIGRIIGLDVGDKRIGVAVSDELGWTAQGREVIGREDGKEWEKLLALVRETDAIEVVVGLPLSHSGQAGVAAEKVQAFIAQWQDKIGVPVKTWDERFSTVAAERVLLEGGMRRRDRRLTVDKVAAAIILQGYLDRQARKRAIEAKATNPEEC